MTLKELTPQTVEVEPVAAPADSGPPLPELPPQPRVRLMVRDPETTFVYWEGKDQPLGWEVHAEDKSGRPSRTQPSLARAAYVEAPVAELDRVVVRPVASAEASAAPARSAALPWTPPAAPSAAAPLAAAPAAAEEPAPRWRAVGDPAPAPEPVSASPAPRPRDDDRGAELFPTPSSPYSVPG